MLSVWIWLFIAVAIVVILNYRYRYIYKILETERGLLLEQDRSQRPAVLTEELIQGYPPIVKLWLTRSGVLHKAFNGTVHLQQKGRMRTGIKNKWMPVKAEQWFSTTVPGFLWSADVKISSLLHLAGKDRYINGTGHMLINFLSIIPVVNAKGPEIDQGSLVRYLAEMVWFPYAAVNNYIQWSEVDALTARATITYGGISASALFRFSKEGDFISLKAKRYYSEKGRSSLKDWIVETEPEAYCTFEGIRVPDRLRVTWLLKNGLFTWFLLKITDIKYHEDRKYEYTKSQHQGSF